MKHIKKYWIFLISGIIVIAIGYTLLDIFLFNPQQSKVYKIAYVGRYSSLKDSPMQIERSRRFNYIHEYSIGKYINEFNKKSTIRLKLETFNNGKNPDSTLSVYKRIHADSSIVMVIDNSWGADLRGAQEFIKKNGIPIIAINGDMNDLDYGSALFTGNGDNQVEEIVNFAKKGIRTDTVNFISETDYGLHDKYLKFFHKHGIYIKNEVLTPPLHSETDTVDVEMILAATSKNYITILNVHSQIGNQIINAINDSLDSITVLGHASVISNGSIQNFNESNRLIVLSQSENALPKSIALDIIEFRNHNKKADHTFNSALFFKRCKDSWSILEEYLSLHEIPSRSTVSQFFSSLRMNSVNLKYDILSFDKFGSLIRESSFIEYGRSGENAFSLQLNSEKDLIPNLNFGIEIIDIQSIDLNSNSFGADFYYWLTSDSSFTDVENYITFQNIKPSESEVELINEKVFDNLSYRLYKVSGTFLEKYDEKNYPFDDQEISIDIQILNTAERLRVSFDRESFNQKVDELSLKGWSQDSFYVTVDNTVTSRLKGNLELTAQELNKFKNISFRFKVTRSKLPGLLQVILPLFFIGILAVALLFLKNLDFSYIGEPLAAVFLTIIAFSISLSDITPTGSVLTKTDFLFILTLVTVVSSFLIGLFYNTKYSLNRKAVEISRTSLLIVYVVLFGLIAFINS
ncbi:MAG: hypothetical protein JXR03_17460 [Cyclobacteriaceae bacterium]